MGITITAKYEGAPEYDMGYGQFFCLRRDVAYLISNELGDLYSKLPGMSVAKPEVQRKFNDDMEALLQKYKVRKRLIPFFYRSDCGGYLSPKQCEALRMCLESPFIEPEIEYGYDAPWCKRMTICQFRELLAECCKRKVNLIWR